MHEELYLKNSPVYRVILFIIGLLLLPFSMLTIVIEDGETVISFYFDIVILAAAVLISLSYFLPFGTQGSGSSLSYPKLKFLRFPFFAVLALEFLRFGTVSLFNRQIRFDLYIVSAFFELAALGFSFIMYFIAEGKIRSRKPLFVWSSLLMLLGICSLIFGFYPFLSYSEKVKGIEYISISRFIQFMLFNMYGFVIALSLQNDKVRAERALRKEEKRNSKRK